MTEEQRCQAAARSLPGGLRVFGAAASLLVGQRSMRLFSLLTPRGSTQSLATHPLLIYEMGSRVWDLGKRPDGELLSSAQSRERKLQRGLSDNRHSSMTDSELEFSKKYDDEHARRYFEKHGTGLKRRLNTWRERGMARRALEIAGSPASVLDLPCGTGRFWEMLAEKPGRKIYAADLNEAMFKTGLEERPPQITCKVEAFKASAFSIPKPDNFVECVFSIRLLHHIPKPEDRMAILNEFKRVTSSTIVLSLWIDGNFRAWRRLSRPRIPGPSSDRYVVQRSVLEKEFAACGLRVLGRADFLKFYSMWSAYVLKK